VDETDPIAARSAGWRTGTCTHEATLPPSPSYTSIGGLVFDELGRVAGTGDIVHKDGYSIRVESIRGTGRATRPPTARPGSWSVRPGTGAFPFWPEDGDASWPAFARAE
jgi:hypothetical protein